MKSCGEIIVELYEAEDPDDLTPRRKIFYARLSIAVLGRETHVVTMDALNKMRKYPALYGDPWLAVKSVLF